MSIFLLVYVLAGLVGAVGFVLLYAIHPMTRHSWWRWPAGRDLMAYSVTASLFYLSGTINLWFPDWAYRNEARVVLASCAITAVWWRLVLLVREVRKYNRKKANHGNHD